MEILLRVIVIAILILIVLRCNKCSASSGFRARPRTGVSTLRVRFCWGAVSLGVGLTWVLGGF